MSDRTIPVPDPELVWRAQQRDATGRPTSDACAAFTQLYESCSNQVFTFLRHTMSRMEDAQDVAQEAFTRAFKALPQKNPEAPFAAWLMTIVIHERNRFASPPGPSPIPLDKLLGEDLASPGIEDALIVGEMIRSVLQNLPLREREVLLLRRWYGFSTTETASILGIAPESVSKTLLRAKLGFVRHYHLALQQQKDDQGND